MNRWMTKKHAALVFGFIVLMALPFTIIKKQFVPTPSAKNDTLNPYKEPKDPAEAFIHRASDNYFYREFDEGAVNYRKAIAIFEDRQNWARVAKTYESLGDLYIWAKRPVEAESSYLMAVKFHDQDKNALGQANALKELADLQFKLENYEASESWYLKSLGVMEQEKNNRVVGSVHEGLGHLYWKTERLPEAIRSFTRAQESYADLNYSMGYEHMANILVRLKKGKSNLHGHAVRDSY